MLETSLQSRSDLLPETLAFEAAVGASRAERSTEESAAAAAASSSREETLASAQLTDTSAYSYQLNTGAGEQQRNVLHLETAAAHETLLQQTDTAARQYLVVESAPVPELASAQLTERPAMHESSAALSIAERSTSSVQTNAQSKLLVESEAATASDVLTDVAWQQQQDAEPSFEHEHDERTQDDVLTQTVAPPASVESSASVFNAEQQELEHTVAAADTTLPGAEGEQLRPQQWPQHEALSVETCQKRFTELLIGSEREAAAQSFAADENKAAPLMALRRSEKLNPIAPRSRSRTNVSTVLTCNSMRKAAGGALAKLQQMRASSR